MQKVSFEVKIPKNWFSEPDKEPKIYLDPGTTEPVSRPDPDLGSICCYNYDPITNSTVVSLRLGIDRSVTKTDGNRNRITM